MNSGSNLDDLIALQLGHNSNPRITIISPKLPSEGLHDVFLGCLLDVLELLTLTLIIIHGPIADLTRHNVHHIFRQSLNHFWEPTIHLFLDKYLAQYTRNTMIKNLHDLLCKVTSIKLFLIKSLKHFIRHLLVVFASNREISMTTCALKIKTSNQNRSDLFFIYLLDVSPVT